MDRDKELINDLLRITKLWMEWSLNEQNKLFNSSRRNKRLFKKAKEIAKY